MIEFPPSAGLDTASRRRRTGEQVRDRASLAADGRKQLRQLGHRLQSLRTDLLLTLQTQVQATNRHGVGA